MFVEKNNASLIEDGLIREIPSTCMLMKIMCYLNRSRTDERSLYLIEAVLMKQFFVNWKLVRERNLY